MVSRFVVEANPETRTYEPVDLHVKMERRLPDGTKEPVSIDLVSIEMDREGLIVLTPKGAETGEPILVYEVQLTDELLGASDFATKIEKPIRVTFTARPESDAADAPQAAPLKEDCDVEIRAPGAVHWTIGDDLSTRDLPLEIDADGVSELMLSVRYEEWDPELRKFEYDATKVEFTHWTGEGLPADVFNAHPDDLPWETISDTNNRDHSRWASLKELPDPGHDGLNPPVTSYIRVRVWPRGSILRLPSRIRPKEGARRLAEKRIPITLRPARQIVELIDPTEPIAADGQSHELRLRFLRERDRTPIKKGNYDFEIERGPSYRGGALTETSAELKEEQNGELTLEYTPAELTYEPKKSFTERLLIHRGTGKQRQLLATIPLHLSPKVELRIEAEKAGLEFEPYEVSIPAGSAPHKIRGNLVFDVYNRESSKDVPIDIALARVKAFAGDVQVDGEVTSNSTGMYEITLAELEEGLRKLPESRRVHQLDKATERPTCKFDDNADTVIRFYEDKTDRFTPWVLYTGEATTKIKTHRVLFAKQIAEHPEDQLPRIVAGTELLRTGTTFATTWLNMYNQMIGSVLGQLKLTALELVSFAMNTEKFAKMLGNFLKGGLDLASRGASALGNVGRALLTSIGPALSAAAQRISAGVDDLIRYIGVDNISTKARALLDLIRARFVALREAAEQLQMSRGQRLIEYGLEIVSSLLSALALATKALVRLLVSAIGGLTALAMRGAGAGFEALAPAASARLLRTMQQLGSRWFNIREGGATTLGKVLEELVKAGADYVADWLVDGSPSPFGPDGSLLMSQAAEGGLSYLHQDVTNLAVPEDADPNIERFRSASADAIGTQSDVLSVVGDLNYYVKQLDLVILVGELAVIAVGVVCTGPVGGAALATMTSGSMVTFDRGFAAFKGLTVRGIPLVLMALYAAAIPMRYAWGTASLTNTTGAVGGSP